MTLCIADSAARWLKRVFDAENKDWGSRGGK